MFSKVVISLLGCASVLANEHDDSTTNVVPNSCNDLEDGVYTMKLIDDDDYPLVSIRCSNGFGILDYSLDNSITDYLDTYYKWFPKTIGPTNEEHVNWEGWFLPHTSTETEDDNEMDLGSETKYVLSPDCTTCESTHFRQLYGLKTTYWMTGTIFGCFWAIKGNHNCDIDYDTNTCYTCDTARGDFFYPITDNSTADDYLTTGICPHNVQSSDYYVPTLHDDCAESEDDSKGLYHLKPALGTEGEHCVCFQQESTEYYTITEQELETYKERLEAAEQAALEEKAAEEEAEEELENGGNHVLLYQSDFADGTYRILESGTYLIMEDIEFDFNSNPDSPNLDRSYLPESSQADDYPGAGTYKGSYFLGFFAGITVEADDVVIDLNGHTLRMSDYFYQQQRWFTTIELGTQYFLPGQGTGNFGGSPVTPSNIEIKNGALGLTSHHGIHGNSNTNVVLKNIHVYDFETHGIQFNGFDNIYMEDIEVGPTSGRVYFNGEYGHMRQLLVRYKEMADDVDEQYANGEIDDDEYYIQFDGRDAPVTMRDITDQLESFMNIAFNYIVKQQSYTEQAKIATNNGVSLSKDDFDEAIRLFVSTDTRFVPNAAAQYGIFLNTFGASVFTYNLKSNYYSTDATLINIKIHGMRHSMKEYVQWHEYDSKNFMVNPFGGPLNVYELLNDVTELGSPSYKGNIITDAVIASNIVSNSFDMLALQVIKNSYLVPWALGKDDAMDALTGNLISSIQIGCNSDVMIHSGKGINGLRLDGVENVYVKNIEIFDNVDQTPLGETVCGEYDALLNEGLGPRIGGHFRQTMPMQTGFSGNMNQAININAAKGIIFENVYIHDIASWTGPSFGMSIWPSCEVELKGDISINNLNAGTNIDDGTYAYSDRPNKAPEVCGIRTYYSFLSFGTTVTDDDAVYSISDETLNGHIGCFGTDTVDILSEDQFDIYVATTTSNSTTDSSSSDSTDDEDEDEDATVVLANEMITRHNSHNNNNNNNFIVTITFISFMVFGLATLAFVFMRDREGYVAIKDAN